MKRFKGLYVEDEPDNITIYTGLFELAGLDLIPASLPMELKDYYPVVLENDIDFLIIDYHLEKAVTYKGTDVLKAIRQHDSTIYAVLLTNYDWEDFKHELGAYDYELKKDSIREKCQDVAEKIKRACMLQTEQELEAAFGLALQKDDETLAQLREINKKLDGIE